MASGTWLWVLPYSYHLFAVKSLERKGGGGITFLLLEIHPQIIQNYSVKMLVLKDR